MLIVKQIFSKVDFAALNGEWNSLLKESGRFSPFLSHEWFSCCLDCYGKDKEIFILAVMDGKETIGFAPLWIYKSYARGIPVKTIGFISCQETAIADFPLKRKKSDELLGEIYRHIRYNQKINWDIIQLEQLPKHSPTFDSLVKMLTKENQKFSVQTSSIAPYIKIERDWDSFFNSRSLKFRKSRRNILNKIKKHSKVDIECHTSDSGDKLMDVVLSISSRSWKEKEGVSISSNRDSEKFFRKLTKIADPKGWLFVWILKLDGMPVAMEYDLSFDGRVYALRSDYDQAYGNHSPGGFLEYQIIKHTFENGFVEYNAGPGLNEYKLQWTNEVKENISLKIYNNTLAGLAAWCVESKLIPSVRKVKERILKG